MESLFQCQWETPIWASVFMLGHVVSLGLCSQSPLCLECVVETAQEHGMGSMKK